ncbi:HD-GYP domain-containing protein [Aneurinibacillus tyrosinisolvens]|uniref:HD-GYP domain-containing protein n=1 Tax=Aneurinibacillus tyrosinisolvens TaxID=1443435 RepID=UPI00069C1A69|nr:HD-GYP domain-containing protein [Aneurinibacillus tyrosinisolvens]
MSNLSVTTRIYIFFHVLITLFILFKVTLNEYSVSFPLVLPFVFLGSLFESSRLNILTINHQSYRISAGTAIIIAAVVLFNPLEVAIFAACYGLSLVFIPRYIGFTKALFNVCETINVIFLASLVWNTFQTNNSSLLQVDNIFPLLVTVSVFVIIDTLAVCTVVALASETNLLTVWKESLDWVLVSSGLLGFIGVILAVVYEQFNIYGLIGFIIPLVLMRCNMHLFLKQKDQQMRQLADFNEQLRANNDQLILTLSQVVDARDNSLFGHSATVAKYAAAIGSKLNLSEEEMYDLKRGALLHDIGKMGISEAILQKPGKLTDEEFEIVKQHTTIGENIIGRVKGMETVSKIIGQHHEFFNGAGYPRKLSGDEILLQSRIVSLCDALDTMLSTRSYKEGWPIERAVAELVSCSGTQFDPQIVEAFIRVREEKGDYFFGNSARLKETDLLPEHALITEASL